MGAHWEMGAQTRLLVAVGATLEYWVELHEVVGEHTLLTVQDGARVSNSPVMHVRSVTIVTFVEEDTDAAPTSAAVTTKAPIVEGTVHGTKAVPLLSNVVGAEELIVEMVAVLDESRSVTVTGPREVVPCHATRQAIELTTETLDEGSIIERPESKNRGDIHRQINPCQCEN